MPYEVINVHISGPRPDQTKKEIQKDAASLGMSVSAFMMGLYAEWKKKTEK